MAEQDGQQQQPPQEPPQGPQEPPAAPSAAEMQGMQEIAQAGQQAAMEGKDPAEAMKVARDRTGIAFSDEDIDRIATGLSDKLMASLRDAGAFDPPLEQVAPPAPPAAPPAPGESPAEQAAPALPEAPKTWAQRFLGG